MKVTLENFGPIRKVEFDLSKDLNVIFGKNNIGKSYAITALYILLKHLLAEFGGSSRNHLQLFRQNWSAFDFSTASEESHSSLLENIVKEVRIALRNDSQEYEMGKALVAPLHHIFSSALQELLSNSFNNSFQSVKQLENELSRKPLSIVIETAQVVLTFTQADNAISLNNLSLNHSVLAKKSKINLETISNDQRTTVYFKQSSNKNFMTNRLIDVDFENVSLVLQILLNNFSKELRSVTHAIYFLPASRSGLYQALSTFGALFAELSKSRNFVTNSISLPNISEPVSDYFLRLSN